MSTVYETMRRFISGNHTIRLWIAFSGDHLKDDDIEAQAREIALKGLRDSTEQLADRLSKLPVNAVEVLDHDGNGHLVYPDWP
jgi:hypothetical protein